MTEHYVVYNGWLCEYVDSCTCAGFDQYGHKAHEPGCGLDGLATVDHLLAEAAEAHRLRELNPCTCEPLPTGEAPPEPDRGCPQHGEPPPTRRRPDWDVPLIDTSSNSDMANSYFNGPEWANDGDLTDEQVRRARRRLRGSQP